MLLFWKTQRTTSRSGSTGADLVGPSTVTCHVSTSRKTPHTWRNAVGNRGLLLPSFYQIAVIDEAQNVKQPQLYLVLRVKGITSQQIPLTFATSSTLRAKTHRHKHWFCAILVLGNYAEVSWEISLRRRYRYCFASISIDAILRWFLTWKLWMWKSTRCEQLSSFLE